MDTEKEQIQKLIFSQDYKICKSTIIMHLRYIAKSIRSLTDNVQSATVGLSVLFRETVSSEVVNLWFMLC